VVALRSLPDFHGLTISKPTYNPTARAEECCTTPPHPCRVHRISHPPSCHGAHAHRHHRPLRNHRECDRVATAGHNRTNVHRRRGDRRISSDVTAAPGRLPPSPSGTPAG